MTIKPKHFVAIAVVVMAYFWYQSHEKELAAIAITRIESTLPSDVGSEDHFYSTNDLPLTQRTHVVTNFNITKVSGEYWVNVNYTTTINTLLGLASETLHIRDILVYDSDGNFTGKRKGSSSTVSDGLKF